MGHGAIWTDEFTVCHKRCVACFLWWYQWGACYSEGNTCDMRHHSFVLVAYPSQGQHGFLGCLREVVKGRYFTRKETNVSLLEVEPQVECIHLPRCISHTRVGQVMGKSVNCITGRNRVKTVQWLASKGKEQTLRKPRFSSVTLEW